MLNKSGIIYQDINDIRTASYWHELLIIHCWYKKLPKNQSAKARKEIEIAFKLIEAELENHPEENKAKRAVGSCSKKE